MVGMPTALEMAAMRGGKPDPSADYHLVAAHPFATRREAKTTERAGLSGRGAPAVAASVGAAFSMRPWRPPVDGFIGIPAATRITRVFHRGLRSVNAPPSVWMISAPAASRSKARATCAGSGAETGTSTAARNRAPRT